MKRPDHAIQDRWRRARTLALGCLAGVLSLGGVLAVALIVVATVPDGIGLLASVTAASIPALIYAGIVLRLDRYEIEPWRTVAACFAWGAVGAVLLSIIGGLVFQDFVERRLGIEAAEVASVVIGAPIIEESFKGIAVLAVLLIARDEFDSVLDGLVYGALVGVGFAMTENILYFGGTYISGDLGDFGILVLARAGLGGLGHPAYTAVTGAAIGWSRGRYGQGVARFIVPVLGWLVAVALHVAWNGGLVLTAIWVGEDAGLLQMVATQTLVVIVPAVAVLYTIARLSARHELEILRQELQAEVSQGNLTRAEYLAITDDAQRRHALARALAAGGRRMRGELLAFFHVSADLAFRHHHRGRGEQSTAQQLSLDERDRQRLQHLRQNLAASGYLILPSDR